MREAMSALAQAMADQAIALGTVADQVRTLKQTLARQFPELADELKGQMAADQEQTLKDVYALQVSLAKVREAIAAEEQGIGNREQGTGRESGFPSGATNKRRNGKAAAKRENSEAKPDSGKTRTRRAA